MPWALVFTGDSPRRRYLWSSIVCVASPLPSFLKLLADYFFFQVDVIEE